MDGNPRNNHVANLEWCTASHNVRHAYEHGLINPYRNQAKCANCGTTIADRSESGLCGTCQTKFKNANTLKQSNVFLAVVEFKKKLLCINNSDIAEMCGYKKDTIDKFLSGKRLSAPVADAISVALSVDRTLFTP